MLGARLRVVWLLTLLVAPLAAPAQDIRDDDDNVTFVSAAAWTVAGVDIATLKMGDYGQTFLIITSGDTVAFTGAANGWLIGHMLQEDLPLGSDINGDGRADFVAAGWSGGAHCCYGIHIFSLEGGVRLLDVLSGGDYGVHFEQLDDEPDLEAIVWENEFAYWNASFADSASPRVILKWDGNAFVAAPDLMRQPPPDEAELREQAAIVRGYDDWNRGRSRYHIDVPPPLWWIMLDQIYRGNLATAEHFLDIAWPPEKEGKEAFHKELFCQLARAQWWQTVAPLNGLAPDPPAEDCPPDPRYQ